MFLTWLMFAVALCLSAVAAFYSIIGLTAIFAAAVIPIIIMGTMLEIAKLTVTVWLHEYWRDVKWTMKAYLVPAVAILMVITSMGIFGFLSKAHLDQAVPTGDVAAQVAIFDEKIKTQRDNIEAARAALRQLDVAVDQTMARSADEKGAERAVQIRRSQQAERNRLQRDIAQAQNEITRLNTERAPIASELRKVEAEVGPVKYIAALIYGDNPDTNLLEKAVRWVIIILVIVFDPLAIFMLLAATESYRWEKSRRKENNDVPTQEKSNDSTTVLDEVDASDLDGYLAGNPVDHESMVEVVEPTGDKKPGPVVKYQVVGDADDEDPSMMVETTPEEPEQLPQSLLSIPALNPLVKPVTEGYVDYDGKTYRESVLYETHPELRISDHDTQVHFGTKFSNYPSKGDMFLRTDYLPTRLYKFNGTQWIEVDKSLTDRYAFNDSYIDHLISKIGSGEYDPELLSDSERTQLENRLRQEGNQ